MPLPFDAVWETRKLIVEVDEDQHDEPTPILDKPDVITVSGVHRGQQRRIYDKAVAWSFGGVCTRRKRS